MENELVRYSGQMKRWIIWTALSVPRYHCSNSVLTSFLRPKATREDSDFIYHFPEIRDFSYFSFDQIVSELNELKPYGRHGLLLFNVHINQLKE
jgi:hypothetical protein